MRSIEIFFPLGLFFNSFINYYCDFSIFIIFYTFICVYSLFLIIFISCFNLSKIEHRLLRLLYYLNAVSLIIV